MGCMGYMVGLKIFGMIDHFIDDEGWLSPVTSVVTTYAMSSEAGGFGVISSTRALTLHMVKFEQKERFPSRQINLHSQL